MKKIEIINWLTNNNINIINGRNIATCRSLHNEIIKKLESNDATGFNRENYNKFNYLNAIYVYDNQLVCEVIANNEAIDIYRIDIADLQ